MTDQQIVSLLAVALPLVASLTYLVGYWQGGRCVLRRLEKP